MRRNGIRWWRLFLIVAIFFGSSAPVLAQKRVALVIGNSSYTYVRGLVTPVNDAEAIAEKLWISGFEVIEVIDADLAQMQTSLSTFANRLDPGDEAVFYYSGHSVQAEQTNLLLPVSVHPASLEDLIKQSVSAQSVIDIMNNSDVRLSIMILDSCRSNPFDQLSDKQIAAIIDRRQRTADDEPGAGKPGALSQSTKAGLVELSSSGGETLIAFASTPGSIAFGGDGTHSPYTQAILQNIAEPGIEIGEVFRRVQAEVREATNGRQISWTSSTLENPFYFRALVDELQSTTTGMTDVTDTLGVLPPRRVIDASFWRTIWDSGNPDDYVAYLKFLPTGRYATIAREGLKVVGRPVPDQDFEFLPSFDPLSLISLAEDVGDPLAVEASVVPVGVGSILLGELQAYSLLGRWVFVTEPPQLGYALLGEGKTLWSGTVVWAPGNARLSYEPVIGSNGGDDRIGVEILLDNGAKLPAEQPVVVWVHACDLLAGMPHDTRRVTAGMRQQFVDLNYDAAITVCKIAVEQFPNIPRFWAQLARAYRSAGDYKEARDWYQKAADAKYMAAVIDLGQMHINGQALTKDMAKARALFDLAAAAEEPRAFSAIASIYRYGNGVPVDFMAALEWQRKGADAGLDLAMFNIGEHYQYGLGVEQDFNEAVKWYSRAATSGELSAQYRLGRMYLRGDEITQDYGEAKFWFEAAAGQGLPNAFTRLGLMHERALGVDRDLDIALRYFTHAVRNGDGEALVHLGRFYAKGEGVERNADTAVQLFRLATEAGVTGMERDFAKLYEAGDGVPKDPNEALRLYKISANANPWAARDVARLYAAAEGVGQDFAKAALWYERAARDGAYLASLDLASLYRAGHGVTRDPVRTLLWVALALGAADPGDDYVRRKVDEFVNEAAPADLVAAANIFLTWRGYEMGSTDGVASEDTIAALRDLAAGSEGLIAADSPIDIDLLAAIAVFEQ